MWELLLTDYPDPQRAAVLVDGIRNGVNVQYDGPLRNESIESNNFSVAYEFPHDITDSIANDCRSGTKAGPFTSPPFNPFTVSPLFTVPKKNTHKRRLIHDLSFPRGASVNTGIDNPDVSLASFDRGVELVQAAGRHSFMCKIDIEAAYRQIPVRPQDFHLLGMKWKGLYYFDKCLPFGLSSSCAIFEWFSSAAEWAVKHHSRNMIKWLTHYIDDFFLVASTRPQAERQLEFLLIVFRLLGIPISKDKLEGPLQVLVFLGIEIDTILMEARLPANKLIELVSTVKLWLNKNQTTRKELESLIGVLSFACKVVRSGRTFLRRLIDTASSVSSPHVPIAISSDSPLRLDLLWWDQFLLCWNGSSLLLPRRSRHATFQLHTDACNTGYGAVLKRHGIASPRWLASAWSPSQLEAAYRTSRLSMPYLEMLAVVIALSSWASRIANSRVALHCDCQPVVNALRPHRYTSPDPYIMSCIRTILFVTAQHNIQLIITHIAGVDNALADSLSRAQFDLFRQRCPGAQSSADTPSPPPAHSW